MIGVLMIHDETKKINTKFSIDDWGFMRYNWFENCTSHLSFFGVG